MIRTATAALLLTALASPAALAQPGTQAGAHGGGDRHHGAARMMERLDTDKDGAISREEFAAGQTRFQDMDADNDGVVTREEALAHARAKAEERVNRMFDRVDTDKDGRITQAEADAMRTRMFDRMDRNNDGRLTREDKPARGADGGRR